MNKAKKKTRRTPPSVTLELTSGEAVTFKGSLDVLGGLVDLVAMGLRIVKIKRKQ